MNTNNTFSCCVIGETTLLVQCGEKLLQRGHTIHGVISPNPDVIKWAADNGISHLSRYDDLAAFLQQQPFDYLFSIVNNAVLPESILRLPRKLAINFHDAPLPRYGGLHATSWALINRERTHGISWHVMAPRIDAGGILKQKMVLIADTDTALSLNIKCYQASADAFAELIEELSSGTAVETGQNPAERTYYPRYQRPVAACSINWDAPAEEIDALVRALDFGPYANPLGVPKTLLAGTCFIVTKVHLLGSSSTAASGTVMAADSQGIIVATQTRDIRITAAAGIDGESLSMQQLIDNFGIKRGHCFAAPEPHTAELLTRIYKETSRHESYWRGELFRQQPLSLPDMSLEGAQRENNRSRCFAVEMPEEVFAAGSVTERRHYVSALFAAFLARHTGVSDFCVGCTFAALTEELDGCAGLFATTLPLHLTADLKKPAAQQLFLLAQQIQSLEKHKTYSRDLALRCPELRSAALPRYPIIMQQVESLDDYTVVKDIALALIVAQDGKSCRIVFAAGLVDEQYAFSLKNQFSAFLKAVAAAPGEQLSRLPLVSAEEKTTIIECWNDTRRDFNTDICMHELFEQQVLRQPDAVATIFEGTEVTYADLNTRANRVARHLRKQGVTPGMLVGVCLDRCHDMIAGLLGILKAGCAYVPLEPAMPAERIAVVVERAGIAAILTQQRYAAMTRHPGVTAIVLDQDGGRLLLSEGGGNPPSTAKPDDLAYVIYTSGSTGSPKGVAVSHRPAINLFEWVYRTCNFTPQDCVLFITSLGFDLSVFDIFGMLGCGGKIYIVEDHKRRDTKYLARTLGEERITFWDSAPAALQLLLPSLKALPQPLKNSALRQVFLSGDWIPVTLPDEIRAVFPGARIMSLGGATEATVWSNYFPVNRVEPHWRSIPYGRPIQNCRYYILDEHQAVCPPGVTGDLYIAGECLSQGYLNESELTDRSYVPDPFSDQKGERMYRTGDLARYFPDGAIEFLGRSDFQVKVRGYRIELGEIEQELRRHELIREAVVTVQKDPGGDQKLVAYLISANGALPAPRELRSYAARYLPDYMVPNLFARLENFPLSPNGKVDRKQLPWPVRQPATEQKAAPPVPSSPDRESLTALLTNYFKEVLAIAAISPDDDFFDLGVTSLNLIQIAEKLQHGLQIDISVEVFLDNPSIRAVAAHILKNASADFQFSGALQTLPSAAAGLAQVTCMQHVPAGTDTGLAVAAISAPCRENNNSLIRKLSGHFTAILGISDLSPDDDIFDLGVTSLNLIQIAERLQQQNSIAVPVEVFLDHATIRDIAAYIESTAAASAVTIEKPVDLHAAVTRTHEALAARPSPALQEMAGVHDAIELDLVSFSDEAYLCRSCSRSFSSSPVPLRTFSQFLGLLKQEKVQGQEKYLYPSAGGLNAVQTYLYIRKNRVEGLDEGMYYYHPARHALILVAAGRSLDPELAHPANREMLDKAGFCIFFIAQLAAIAPVYSSLSTALATLDAGYMGQLLMGRQQRYAIGLCPVAGINSEKVRDLFKLEDSHLFVHCLVGGFVNGAAAAADKQADTIAGYISRTGRKLTGCYAGTAPERTSLEAVAAARLGALNALTDNEHEDLHRRQLHLRRFEQEQTPGSLPLVTYMHNEYLLRSTRRSFSQQPVAFNTFSGFMALLKRETVSGQAKYLYPSAGGIYAVQTYLHIKQGAVEHVPEGIYHYHPDIHVMSRICARPAADIKSAHLPGNRSYYAEAGFSIFLIARLSALQPMYDGESLYLAMLESGYIGQVLMERQAEFNMGVCPIGAMRFDLIRPDFRLEGGDRLVHSFLCGPVERTVSLAGHECLKIL